MKINFGFPVPKNLELLKREVRVSLLFFFLKNEMGGKGVAMLPVGPPDSAS